MRGERPAAMAQQAVLTRCGAAMRTAVGLAAFAAAVLAPAAHAHAFAWSAAAANLLWTTVFLLLVLRRGLTPGLVLADAGLTAVLCLTQRWIVPAALVINGVSWIAVLLTTTMVLANFVWRPPRAAAVCLGLMACHLIGARSAGAADGGVVAVGIQAVQVASLAVMMTLIRRAARLADDVISGLRAEQRQSAAASWHRAEEEARSDELHNKVLATLTAVATGGIAGSTALLREQSAVAVQVLTALRDPLDGEPSWAREEAGAGGTVALADRLRAVAEAAPVRVDADLEPFDVPPPVAEAVTGAVVEALANVGRHAGTGHARLILAPGLVPGLAPGSDGLRVEISDDGAGFDPAAVPAHRYGTRHAVIAALRRVGGDAVVESAPGLGTRVELWWPA